MIFARIFAGMVLFLALAGCRNDMYNQPKKKPGAICTLIAMFVHHPYLSSKRSQGARKDRGWITVL